MTEDSGDSGICEFTGPEYDGLCVVWSVLDGVCRYSVEDENLPSTTEDGPDGWRNEFEKLTQGRATEFFAEVPLKEPDFYDE